ncbi:hypothetical protein P4I92_20325 [Bacillus cereus]
MNYFCIDIAYKQNNERFLDRRMFQTEDDINETMEAYSVATKRAYEKAFVITQCDLISVTPREVSEIEYNTKDKHFPEKASETLTYRKGVLDDELLPSEC